MRPSRKLISSSTLYIFWNCSPKKKKIAKIRLLLIVDHSDLFVTHELPLWKGSGLGTRKWAKAGWSALLGISSDQTSTMGIAEPCQAQKTQRIL